MSSSAVALLAIAVIGPPLWMLALRAPDGLHPTPAASLETDKGATGHTHFGMDHKYFKIRTHTGSLIFNSNKWEFGMVTDLDKSSKENTKPGKPDSWKAYLKHGFLERHANGTFSVSWGTTTRLATHTATKGRSMELSELIRFNRNFFAMCDMTGIIWKVLPESGTVFQRYAIADGNGDVAKPFKTEWATVKDRLLWVGSVGKEISPTDRPAEWVKTIHPSGDITNIDWGAIYQTLRTATGTSLPGYLWHEAVHFDHRNRKWIILPRKESKTAYDEEENQFKGSNLLLICSEDFSEIVVRRVGPLDPMYGFTTLRKLPGMNSTYIALKVAEFANATHDVQRTVITVFDLDGNILLGPEPFAHVADMKYEGIEFFGFGAQVKDDHPSIHDPHSKYAEIIKNHEYKGRPDREL